MPANGEKRQLNRVLAIDIGTGSCRGAIYDQALNCLGRAAVAYATRYPQPGWAEQNPDTVFAAVLEAITGAISDSRLDPADITALTLDGPLHTCLGLTAEGMPATPVLTWEDARAR